MADDELDMHDESLEEDEEMEGLEEGDNEEEGSSSSSDATTESAEEIAAAALAAHSGLAARNKMREAMQSDVEAFLAKGGKIQQVEDNVMSDPPRKPTSSYGSRPI